MLKHYAEIIYEDEGTGEDDVWLPEPGEPIEGVWIEAEDPTVNEMVRAALMETLGLEDI